MDKIYDSFISADFWHFHFPFNINYTKEFLKEQLAIIFCTSGISFKETLIK